MVHMEVLKVHIHLLPPFRFHDDSRMAGEAFYLTPLSSTLQVSLGEQNLFQQIEAERDTLEGLKWLTKSLGNLQTPLLKLSDKHFWKDGYNVTPHITKPKEMKEK